MLVLLCGVLGFLAGVYVRAAAGAFEADPPDTRAEARRALAALRRWPVPARVPVVELLTGAVCALVAWRAAPPYLPGLLFAGLLGTLLAVVDWRTFRLPDVLTLPAYPILALLLIPTGELLRALLGALALGLLYGVLWFVRPAAMGLGDVKLAGLIGLATAALGWQSWAVAAVGGQVLGACYAVGLLLARKADRSTEFPFGPFMLLGGLAAICLIQ
ncbi:prepilin peptidase [Nonomuraea sp. NPDC050328]|uniref:prepilin peptidase n=1 Tax=Nonomuraea sp. NPDC050328 TaxID=3364361 RepID=UPI0037A39E20